MVQEAEQLVMILGVLSVTYYLRVLFSQPDSDGTRRITFFTHEYISPGPRRVEEVLLSVIRRILSHHLPRVKGRSGEESPALLRLGAGFLRGLEAADIRAMKLRQAHNLRHARFVAGLLLPSFAGLTVAELFGVEVGVLTKGNVLLFVMLMSYDFYSVIRLDLYLKENG